MPTNPDLPFEVIDRTPEHGKHYRRETEYRFDSGEGEYPLVKVTFSCITAPELVGPRTPVQAEGPFRVTPGGNDARSDNVVFLNFEYPTPIDTDTERQEAVARVIAGFLFTLTKT